MRIAVLGPLEIDEGQTQLAPRDQVVLEALAARPGDTVRAEALAEALWGELLPPSWSKVVQGCVSRLRKVLGPAAIVTSGGGYRLVLHRDDFDHLCFEDLLLRAGELLATGEPERARYASGQALGLWRGNPLERITEWESGRIESERLGERRRDAEDLYAESAIRAGRHGEVLGELHRMVAQQPTRERRWGLLALAQYQAGRQAEALGTLKRARTTLVNDFGLDPGPQLAELEEAILRQDPALLAEGTLSVAIPSCPYLGLVAYDIGDATAYFGREADVTACLRRLDAVGVLAVVGPSGCGKSSLIRAGVAAALVRDGHQVQIVTPGAHPEDAFLQAPHRAGSVLVVDQCEEALALDETSAEREAFFAGLVDFASRGRLLISLRADRLGELAAHPQFAHLVEEGLYLLAGMTPTQLRSAIEGPAAQAGLHLEPDLVDLLVREAEGSPGALPLLSHVLRQTWRRREGDTVTVQGYAETGGVREAVAQSAERLYRELPPSQQGMLRDLMVRLVSSDETGEPVRTRVPRRTVTSDDEHTAVVEALVGARLLSSDGDTVEIAHESLAVAWPRLRSWLDDDVDGLRIMRHVAVAAESWEELGRPDSELYRGLRQARAAEWRQGHDPELTPPERAFLDASSELAATEQRATEEQVRRERRSNQRLRAGLAAVAVLLAVAMVAGALAKTAADRADQESVRAEQQSVIADARRLGAEALRAPTMDLALLLAVAGTRLDDSRDEAFGVQLLDVKSGTRAPQSTLRETNAYYADLVWRPDGAVLATAWNDQWVDLWDGVTGKAAGRHRVPDRYGVVDTVRFSGDSTRLVVGTHRGWVYAVEASTLDIVGNPVQVKADVPTYGLAANGDGAHALVWIDGKLQLLDLMQGRVLKTADPGFYAESWAWTPDGRAIVVVGSIPSPDGFGTIAFLDPGDLSMKSTTSGPQIPWGSIQFSPDGQRFATSGRDRVGLWDVPTESLLGTVGVKDGSLAGFANGTSEVLIASPDGNVSLWDPRPETAVKAACRIAGRDLTAEEWRTYLPNREREKVCGS